MDVNNAFNNAMLKFEANRSSSAERSPFKSTGKGIFNDVLLIFLRSSNILGKNKKIGSDAKRRRMQNEEALKKMSSPQCSPRKMPLA